MFKTGLSKSSILTTVVDARLFPVHAGIIDVTANYVSLDVIPASVAVNFDGLLKPFEPIQIGNRYVIGLEVEELICGLVWFRL